VTILLPRSAYGSHSIAGRDDIVTVTARVATTASDAHDTSPPHAYDL
jgi:hypothetical protein